jgi:hypothetical protein
MYDRRAVRNRTAPSAAKAGDGVVSPPDACRSEGKKASKLDEHKCGRVEDGERQGRNCHF